MFVIWTSRLVSFPIDAGSQDLLVVVLCGADIFKNGRGPQQEECQSQKHHDGDEQQDTSGKAVSRTLVLTRVFTSGPSLGPPFRIGGFLVAFDSSVEHVD